MAEINEFIILYHHPSENTFDSFIFYVGFSSGGLNKEDKIKLIKNKVLISEQFFDKDGDPILDAAEREFVRFHDEIEIFDISDVACIANIVNIG
jgi:hypothetical protein